jgi:type I restriction enzyme M protein
MIECKTWGKEFDKELKNIQKDGGQIFSYFQQDRNAEFIMLYASDFNNKIIEYKNEIIKIEDMYRETSNVKDLYDRWNKFTKQNGIFDEWVKSYDFESKALTYDQLEAIKESDASFIFNRFLEILRHNTVSDKPNAFNKMFTLFLCKIYDELDKKDTQKELDFQWRE